MSGYIVGLTGGIGSGKTTVSNLFMQHHKIDVVDADIIARDVVEPGTEGLEAIRSRFGANIINEQHHLNRSKLRDIVFNHPDEKTWLNQLLHPLIRTEMIRQCQEACSAYVILSIPLLVENNLQALAHRILVVDCSEEAQLARGTRRDGVGEAQIKSIMHSQATRKERLKVADDVIVNDVTLADLAAQVTRLHEKYTTLAESTS